MIPDYPADTHRLKFNGVELASHPNGYSCYALAERMVDDVAQRVVEQAEYIVRCGGESNIEAIMLAMKTQDIGQKTET